MVPDWLDFFDDATSIGGMKPEKVLRTLEGTVTDVFGSDFGKVVVERLRVLRLAG